MDLDGDARVWDESARPFAPRRRHPRKGWMEIPAQRNSLHHFWIAGRLVLLETAPSSMAYEPQESSRALIYMIGRGFCPDPGNLYSLSPISLRRRHDARHVAIFPRFASKLSTAHRTAHNYGEYWSYPPGFASFGV
jgi:hypothetical protein